METIREKRALASWCAGSEWFAICCAFSTQPRFHRYTVTQLDITQWNKWREANHKLVPDLRGADLSEAKLYKANLREADLRGAELSRADLSGARCVKANFMQAALVGTQLEQADLTNAHIYGISAWDLQLKDAVQQDLIITPRGRAKHDHSG